MSLYYGKKKMLKCSVHIIDICLITNSHSFCWSCSWKWSPVLLALKKGLAKSVSLKTVKFDKVSVLVFGEGMPCILKETGFKGPLLENLCTFCKGLNRVYKNLLLLTTWFDRWWIWSSGIHPPWLQGCVPLSRSSLTLDTTMLTRPFRMLKLLVSQQH